MQVLRLCTSFHVQDTSGVPCVLRDDTGLGIESGRSNVFDKNPPPPPFFLSENKDWEASSGELTTYKKTTHHHPLVLHNTYVTLTMLKH